MGYAPGFDPVGWLQGLPPEQQQQLLQQLDQAYRGVTGTNPQGLLSQVQDPFIAQLLAQYGYWGYGGPSQQGGAPPDAGGPPNVGGGPGAGPTPPGGNLGGGDRPTLPGPGGAAGGANQVSGILDRQPVVSGYGQLPQPPRLAGGAGGAFGGAWQSGTPFLPGQGAGQGAYNFPSPFQTGYDARLYQSPTPWQNPSAAGMGQFGSPGLFGSYQGPFYSGFNPNQTQAQMSQWTPQQLGEQGFYTQPTLSQSLSQSYFDFLQSQAERLGGGMGATPYGQQQTFLPGWGQSAPMGLTAPETPFARYMREGLTSNVGYQAGGGQFTPFMQQAQQFAQQGAPGGLAGQVLNQAAGGGGIQGLPGQYLNSAMQYGGMGLPANIQSSIAQFGAGPGAGGQTLSNMAQFGGLPIDQTPGWSAMIQAQQRNIQQNMAQIGSRMAATGNLGGTPYQQALADYGIQTSRDQNALLGQMTQQALEQGRQRQLGASQFMGGQQFGAANQLAGTQFGSAQLGLGSQMDAISRLLSGQLQGIQLGGQLGAYNQNALQNLFGMGGGMAQNYQGMDQAAIDRQLQEFMRTRPEYNPLAGQMFAGATTFPGMVTPKVPAGGIGSMIGQAAIGALPDILKNWPKSGGGGSTPPPVSGTGAGYPNMTPP